MNDLDEFARLAVALKPWLRQLVFVGGWAHRLYRWHPLAISQTYQPVTTRDADVAFAHNERLEGNISQALIGAGFTEMLIGEHRPPASYYTLGDDAGFYAEFLTPLIGSGIKRDGKPDATVLTAGITAQKLRHLDVLLLNTWKIPINKVVEGLAEELHASIPNPVSFIVQKILIHKERAREKQPQDILYIHDTLEMFAARIEILTHAWSDLSGKLPNRQRTNILSGIQEMFSSVTDTLRNASRIPQDRILDPVSMQRLCEYSLQELFASPV